MPDRGKRPCSSITSEPELWFSSAGRESTGLQFPEDQCDCDCACSDSTLFRRDWRRFQILTEQVRTGIVQGIQLNHDLFLNHIGENSAALSARGGQVVVLNAQASRLLSYVSVPRTLENLIKQFAEWPAVKFERAVVFLLATGVLTSPQVEQTQTMQDESKTLAAWLHLTHQCNLACRYCYVTRNNHQMDISTARRAVDAVYRAALACGHTRVKLKYAGGEPTLNFGALRAAQRRAEELSVQTGIELESVILTNGTCLAESQIGTLLAHNIRIMISLDGVGLYQDVQRPLVSQDGSSFKLVSSTLDRVLARGISPHISITITNQSIRGLSDLVEFLLDRQLRFSFNFYREPDNSPESKALTLTPARSIEGLRRAFQVIERRLPGYSLLSSLADRADLRVPHLRTCGVGQNYMVVDYNGNVARCPMEAAYPVTTIEADNPLASVRADTRGIQNLVVDQKECRECVWRYHCAGGCPRLTFQRIGRYDAKSPLCQVYRTILPEVVRLEALRLLKYEEPWDFGFPPD
jgi:uncharacterized protein